MDKLQYDSFYKFLVSLGLFLMAIPVLGLYYFAMNENILLMTQEEVSQLSKLSQKLFYQQSNLANSICAKMTWVVAGSGVIGLILVLSGAIPCWGLQKYLDEQIRLTTEEQRQKLEKMTDVEHKANIERELQEDTVSDQGEVKEGSIVNRVFKAMQIEDACRKCIIQRLKENYTLHPNMKIAKFSYDLIAESRFTNIDRIFEFKYFSNVPTMEALVRSVERLKNSGVMYEVTRKRNFRCELWIVVADDKFDKANCALSRHLTHELVLDCKILKESAILQGKV